MASFNSVTLVGNLCRDPELRVTPKGTAICQFGICVNREFKDEGGQKRQEATFVDCEAWNKTGELVAKYLTKGSQCLVAGRLKQETWLDKQTQAKRSKLKVVVENVQFLGGKSDGESGGDAPADTERQSAPPKRNAPPPQEDDTSEDVPF